MRYRIVVVVCNFAHSIFCSLWSNILKKEENVSFILETPSGGEGGVRGWKGDLGQDS
jgi:hypothetical protein